MEIFRLENTTYSAICPKCKNILKFKINVDKFIVEGECKNGHSFNNMSFYGFQSSIQKTSSIKLINCNKCFISRKSKSFKCQTCNKLYCLNCINQHLKEEKHLGAKCIFTSENKLCQKHNELFYDFCNDCNCYICDRCKLDHINHTFISLIDIFPNKDKKQSMLSKTLNFEEKLKNLKSKINNKKNEIKERFETLEKLFTFLLEVNDKLFKNYNYSIFDINNYINFNYIYDFIGNGKLFDENIYLNYIYYNKSLKDIFNNEKDIINNEKQVEKISNNSEILFYKDYSCMKYFKDNLFYISEINNRMSDNYIKMYEFKYLNFQYITTYNINYMSKIKSLKTSKYGNFFLIGKARKKNIQFLEYDYIKKELNLSKYEIKSKKYSFLSQNFNDFIDCKDGSIITAEDEGLKLWEKSNKKYYKEKYIFPNHYYKLFNINDNIFMAKEYNNITFFNIEKLEPIKSCNTKELIESIDYTFTINDKILILYGNNLYMLVSLMHFDIIQIVKFNETYNFLKGINNGFIQYYIKDKKIGIIKQIYNEKKGYFQEDDSIILNSNNYSNDSKLIMIDNNELFIGDKGLISIYTNII